MGNRHYIGREGRAVLIIQELFKQSMYGLPGLTAHTIAVNLGWKPGRYIREVCEWAFEIGLLQCTEEKHTGKRTKKIYDCFPVTYYEELFPNVGTIMRRKFGYQLKLWEDLSNEKSLA